MFIKLALVVALLLAPLALAGQVKKDAPRTIDFTAVLSDADGKPFIESKENPVPLTLGSLSEIALGPAQPQDAKNPPTATQLYKRGELADRIHKHPKTVVLGIDDVKLVHDRIGSIPQIDSRLVFAAWNLLGEKTNTSPTGDTQ